MYRQQLFDTGLDLDTQVPLPSSKRDKHKFKKRKEKPLDQPIEVFGKFCDFAQPSQRGIVAALKTCNPPLLWECSRCGEEEMLYSSNDAAKLGYKNWSVVNKGCPVTKKTYHFSELDTTSESIPSSMDPELPKLLAGKCMVCKTTLMKEPIVATTTSEHLFPKRRRNGGNGGNGDKKASAVLHRVRGHCGGQPHKIHFGVARAIVNAGYARLCGKCWGKDISVWNTHLDNCCRAFRNRMKKHYAHMGGKMKRVRTKT